VCAATRPIHRAICPHLRERRIAAAIPEPSTQQGHRQRRGCPGGWSVSYIIGDCDSLTVFERDLNGGKLWRGLATR